MKIKFFLRGLGVGIVLTALVLCVSYRKSDSSKSVVEQAKELGMVFPEGTKEPAEVTNTPDATKEVEETKKADATDAPKETKKPKEKETVTPLPSAATVVPAVSGAGVSVSQKTKSPKKEDSKYITVKLRNDLLSSTVANELKKAGVIKDAKALDRYFEQSGKARRIMGGTFRFPKGATYKQITDIVTKPGK